MKKIMALLIPAFLLFACSESDNPADNSPDNKKYTKEAPSALVIVVENNDGLEGGMYETAFGMYKEEVLEIFSDMFGVDESEMEDKSLNTIIETYGEEWQINTISAAGQSHYDRIESLSDETATRNGFRDLVLDLSAEGFIVDAVFCLHGGHGTISFSDGSFLVADLAGELKAGDARLRAIYQTNCHAKTVLNTWKDCGVYALNGAEATNNITMFSPSLFVGYWAGGMTFDDAVHAAFDKEIDTLKSYSDVLPIMEMVLTEQNLAGSKQYTGGIDSEIKWNDFPEKWVDPVF